VETSYQGWDGLPHEVAPATLVRVLAALGVQASTDQLIEAALADAERRGLPELKPLLETLARTTVSLREADELLRALEAEPRPDEGATR
jgi:hypothetical protein